jgi:Flp pilus assembly protein TadD
VTPSRAGLLVVLVALAAFANSLGNGFAYDDQGIVEKNPVVTEGDLAGALTETWWPNAMEGAGLYRPFTLLSFTVEWEVFRGSPLGYHAMNVAVHAVVSLLVFLLLLELGPLSGALFGGLVFAVHPLHTEAVANVVGRAELYSAFFFLAACLLYWRGRRWTGWARGMRLAGMGALYSLSLAGKEIGVTLPGILVLLEILAPWLEQARSRFGPPPGPSGGGPSPLLRRLWRETPVFLLLTVVLLAYLGLRYLALGTVAGEAPAPLFRLIGERARILTAFAMWIQYVRLHLFPLDLVVDYDPGVLFPSEELAPRVVVGGLLLAGLFIAARRTWRSMPTVALGLLWFFVTLLPVSNFLFSTGVLLAERTLYLPSVGFALVLAGITPPVLALTPRPRRALLALAFVWWMALFARTVSRNPTWMSTKVVMETLNEEHPEAWRAIRGRALGAEEAGNPELAAEVWDVAVELAPMNYVLLVQAGDFHARKGDWEKARAYFRRAIELWPTLLNAYEFYAKRLVERGEGRRAHAVALEGLRAAGADPDLWALVSESYLMKGDLPAALRARRAAIAADPTFPHQWRRLGDILEAMGREEAAAKAREHARKLEADEERTGSPSGPSELEAYEEGPGGPHITPERESEAPSGTSPPSPGTGTARPS